MEKKQYELCNEILKRLDKSGILSSFVLIGSWCLPFYREYFKNADFDLSLRTRDIDFLIPKPTKINITLDVTDLLKDLGFTVSFSYPAGYMKLQHPDLIIELLVPEKGKDTDKPFRLPKLGLNAQPLRFLELLSQNTIIVDVNGIPVTLPHPANFSLHKLIVAERRKNKDKAEKDRLTGIQVLKCLMQLKEYNRIKDLFNSLSKKWQKLILKSLEIKQELDILDLLNNSSNNLQHSTAYTKNIRNENE